MANDPTPRIVEEAGTIRDIRADRVVDSQARWLIAAGLLEPAAEYYRHGAVVYHPTDDGLKYLNPEMQAKQ